MGGPYNTMVTVWNPADEAQDLVFTLFFSGGHYAYPLNLAPRATNCLNISEIILSLIPDAQGELVAISAGLTDRQKSIAEYWNDGPNTEQPPATGPVSRNTFPNATATVSTRM